MLTLSSAAEFASTINDNVKVKIKIKLLTLFKTTTRDVEFSVSLICI